MDGSFEWVGPDGLGPSLSCIYSLAFEGKRDLFQNFFLNGKKKKKSPLACKIRIKFRYNTLSSPIN